MRGRRREPLSSVIVPTDFSKGAALALERALLLPLAHGASLHIVHVLPPSLPAKVRAHATAEARQRLDRLASRARRDSADREIQVTSELLSGDAFVEIIRRSRSLGAELVVLGRHGRRPIRDMFIGTTAQRVIRKGDVPVLVVNLKRSHPYRKPIVAIDLEDTAPRLLDLALRVLGPTVDRISVVHAFNVPFERLVTPVSSAREKSEYRRSFEARAAAGLATLLEKYENAGVRCKTTIRAGDPRSIVLIEAVRQRADLIAVGTHGRSGSAHAFVGSVAEWIITAAACDVLVARPVRFSFNLP